MGPSSGEATARRGERGWSRTSTPLAAAIPAALSTSAAPSTSSAPTAPAATGSGEATAPRRGRLGQRVRIARPQLPAHRRRRHPLLRRLRPSHTELWRSDGTQAGTALIKQFPASDPELHRPPRHPLLRLGRHHSPIRALAKRRHRGRDESGQDMIHRRLASSPTSRRALYFLGVRRPPPRAPLWRSDGTEAGTSLVKRPGHGFSELTAFKGNLYLSATRALWRSDGTRRGTKLIKGKSSPPSH